MKKIGDAAREIVQGHPMLHFGLHHRLLNLTRVSRFILPLVEARTHKEVSESAVLMALSRLQSRLSSARALEEIVLDKLNIHTGLASLTVPMTPRSRSEADRLFAAIRAHGGFITLSEGIGEVTAIIEDDDFPLAAELLSEQLRHVHRDIASVGVKFSESAVASPGGIYQLVQQVALQDLNIIEVVSTATEFNIYLSRRDARLAFDSIYQRFSKRAGGRSEI
jgi:hypothetical protein